MSRPEKQWHTEWYKAKLCLWYICDFLRERDTTREWGTSVKEFKLIEFQQRLGEKITPDDLVEQVEYSQWKRAMEKRKYRAKLKEKKDYENYLREMREKKRRGK